MARLSKEVVEKRENFLRSFIQKQIEKQAPVTVAGANEALVSHFGAKTPKMSVPRVQELLKEVAKSGGKADTTPTTPTTAKRGPGRPRKNADAPMNGAAKIAGMFLTGDVKRLLALGEAAGVQVQVDTRATEAISALRA